MKQLHHLTIYDSKKKWNEIIFISFLFFIPFLICVFRPLKSMDTEGYYNYFLKANLEHPHPEKSFVYISLFWKKILGDIYGFRCVLFTYAVLAYIVLLEVLKKCDNKFLSFIIFISFAYTYQICIQMRSAVANLIFILALFDVKERKIKAYYLKIFIAFIFHNSAIFFVIVYPILRYIIRNKKILFYLPLLAISGSFFLTSFLTYFVNITKNSSLYIFRALFEYYSLSQVGKSEINPVNTISLSIFCFYYYFIFKIKIKKITDIECISLVVISLSILMYAIGYFFIPIFAERYTVALNLILIIFLPLFMNRCKERRLFLVLLLIYLWLINRQYQTLNFTVSYLLGEYPTY